ncbi:MAG: hypothetical protein COV33_02540 [Candidatus Zambryskibacteria bacterium CG10_big_fil_rev_8_21_14_0_10_34_34]|uniref:Phage-Barnase-EndoU-ColicinE5/D-RelE like nuclease 3 domain-containing protein n=1 Tax=Candidatus Zambryskibacteria bacterium CG10_big_fil_rev_8_21_14_0_10_34_34 TaxID=1975114 RepID=A0A2H0R090_9BACT|nr:MAG: hypothetical protein COV33_02540 [Candidatus Zambryskibacteria bacterium CG10_big_fil_rev_8_21_14_0_10_34_34]
MEIEHRIIKKVKISAFLNCVKDYGFENIEANAHALFRLSQKQRKIFNEETLKKVLWEEKPLDVGVETNGNYNVVYEYKNGKKLRIITNLSTKKLYIVTFYFLNKEQEILFENGKRKKS